MRIRSFVLSALVVLSGCSAPTVPDFTYYRLPRAQPLDVVSAPEFQAPIVVDVFGADGLYADQALIYAVDPGAQQLRQYHYQLWTDPPTRILQRRLISQLRDAGLAPRVTDELPASQSAIRLSGVILRFDRVPSTSGGFTAAVALKLRANAIDGSPMIDEIYHADVPANGTDVKSTVDAYGNALDTIYAQFFADLRKHGDRAHAR